MILDSMTAPALPVTAEQRTELTKMALDGVAASQGGAAKALLLAADGIASFGFDADTVRRWRKRLAESGPEGVAVIATRRGRKSSVPPRDGGRRCHGVQDWVDS